MEKLNQQSYLETEEIKDITPSVDNILEDLQVSAEQAVNGSENLPDYGPIRVGVFGSNIYGDFHN